MRKQLVTTLDDIVAKDQKTVLVFGDVGTYGFRNIAKLCPERVYNIGILEQSMMSLSAGLNMTGLIPIVHTITPFLVERCYEQIKDDFGYQKLAGNLISTGASYDYPSFGCTHHCPADVPILMNIPGVEIVVPGTSEDFDTLFRQTYADDKLTYFRLNERENQGKVPVTFGKANVIKKGKLATVIAVGPLLDKVIAATKDLDVTIIYMTTLRPFDTETVRKNIVGEKVLICEPYYSGAITEDVVRAVQGKSLKIDFVGIPKEFLTNYGSKEEHDEHIGFTEENIKNKVKRLIG